MNLLEKISTIEIQADTRISVEDRRFCQIQQEAYEATKKALIKLRRQWRALVESQEVLLSQISDEHYVQERYYCMEGVSATSIRDKIELLPSLFIKTIVQYFNGKYHVSVDESKISKFFIPDAPEWNWEKTRTKEYHKAMREMVLHYENILEQIFAQLGGRTFEERALDELKEKCHDFSWNLNQNIPEYQIKGDTIQFTGYACSYRTWLSTPIWVLTKGMCHVLRAIAHFETSQFESLPSIISFLIGYEDIRETAYDLNMEKVTRIRFFKNNRVDIKFAGKEYAHQFAEQYLGLVA